MTVGMKRTNLADLSDFLGAYFHEDWLLESSDPDQAVRRFLASGPTAAHRARIVVQIGEYLVSKDEAGVEAGLMSDLGCYYLPSADGIEARAWLWQVANRLGAP